MKLLQNVRELVLDRARAFKLRSIQSKHPIWGVMRTNVGLSPHFPGYMRTNVGICTLFKGFMLNTSVYPVVMLLKFLLRLQKRKIFCLKLSIDAEQVRFQPISELFSTVQDRWIARPMPLTH
jgi:hypothetical protein